MTDIRKQIGDTLAQLKRERDELRVQMQLAKMEAGDEWKIIESRLVKLEAKAKNIGSATAESSKEIGAAAKLLAEEIRDGFRNIARRI